MKCIRLVGLCLVAGFALSAVTASGAQAGQLGKCVKISKNAEKKYTGNYTEKNCSTKSAAKAGKYEWMPNVSYIPFTSEGGVSHLKSGIGEITCKTDRDEGAFLNATEDRDRFTYAECELTPYGLKCNGYGQSAGEITTYPLATKLVDNGEEGPGGKEPAPGEVWESVTSLGNNIDPEFGEAPWLVSFECGGIPLAVGGSLSGVIPGAYVGHALKAGKPGKKGKPGKPTFTEVFSQTGGEQELATVVVNPNNNEWECVQAIQEGTNEVIINPLEKGLEIQASDLDAGPFGGVHPLNIWDAICRVFKTPTLFLTSTAPKNAAGEYEVKEGSSIRVKIEANTLQVPVTFENGDGTEGIPGVVTGKEPPFRRSEVAGAKCVVRMAEGESCELEIAANKGSKGEKGTYEVEFLPPRPAAKVRLSLLVV